MKIFIHVFFGYVTRNDRFSILDSILFLIYMLKRKFFIIYKVKGVESVSVKCGIFRFIFGIIKDILYAID